jgi:hypothetical protein
MKWTVCSLSLLGNGSVNAFSRERKRVGNVVFYAVHVVSKESRRLVLTTTSCIRYMSLFYVIYSISVSFSCNLICSDQLFYNAPLCLLCFPLVMSYDSKVLRPKTSSSSKCVRKFSSSLPWCEALYRQPTFLP